MVDSWRRDQSYDFNTYLLPAQLAPECLILAASKPWGFKPCAFSLKRSLKYLWPLRSGLLINFNSNKKLQFNCSTSLISPHQGGVVFTHAFMIINVNITCKNYVQAWTLNHRHHSATVQVIYSTTECGGELCDSTNGSECHWDRFFIQLINGDSGPVRVSDDINNEKHQGPIFKTPLGNLGKWETLSASGWVVLVKTETRAFDQNTESYLRNGSIRQLDTFVTQMSQLAQPKLGNWDARLARGPMNKEPSLLFFPGYWLFLSSKIRVERIVYAMSFRVERIVLCSLWFTLKCDLAVWTSALVWINHQSQSRISFRESGIK